jgi:hypothetical protein
VDDISETNINAYRVKSEVFTKVNFFIQPPSCPSDILPPKGAGTYRGTMTSLAPFGGKGLRVRGLDSWGCVISIGI